MIVGWVWGGLGQKEKKTKNRSQSDPKTEKTDG